jgi:hypothetical protein
MPPVVAAKAGAPANSTTMIHPSFRVISKFLTAP